MADVVKYLELTEDEFDAKFTPIKNQFVDDCSFNGCMFETYGEEIIFVRNQFAVNKRKIWTIIDGDDDTMVIVSGFHWVNRMGYLITEEMFDADVEITVELDY